MLSLLYRYFTHGEQPPTTLQNKFSNIPTTSSTQNKHKNQPTTLKNQGSSHKKKHPNQSRFSNSFLFSPKGNSSSNKINSIHLNANSRPDLSPFPINTSSTQVPRNIPLTKLTLILDLDETLIHSRFPFKIRKKPKHYPYNPKQFPDFRLLLPVPPEFQNSSQRLVFTWKRPYVHTFLRAIQPFCNIFIWTAGTKGYAEGVIRKLNRHKRITSQFYRNHTIPLIVTQKSTRKQKRVNCKDLSLLNSPLSRTLIVDNNPFQFILHPHNGLAITSWYGQPDDTNLLDLIQILQGFSYYPDVRVPLRWFINSLIPNREDFLLKWNPKYAKHPRL